MRLPALALLLLPPLLAAQPFERTEDREPCAHYDPLRQPLYGDLHVHTRYSFDSYVSSQRNGPRDAYRFAKGEAITLPDADGEQVVEAKLRRPLDFVGLTDHSEFLGPINICSQDRGRWGYWTPQCIATRSSFLILQFLALDYWAGIGVADESAEKSRGLVCALSDCDRAELDTWADIRRAAEEHYDRSSACNFTTFVGYEYTDAPDFRNLHRNVIFRNKHVIDRPISTYDTGTNNFPALWECLREQCLEGLDGCDVMSIPHNPNLAGGLMFPDPTSAREAEDRLFFEPVVELVQHKGASECRFDRLRGTGIGTADELCDFEQIKPDNLSMLGSVAGEVRTDRATETPIDQFHRRNMLRNVLQDGLVLAGKSGINPFKMGFIGSTDTHSATPGATEEDNYLGHLGRRDAGYRNIQDHFFSNPGGHAVVWAEENSRDAIFAAIRRKETYATSGTRITVRFFGGWEFNPDLCQSPDMVAAAYEHGVPMGADLPPRAGSAPRFLVSAMKDNGVPGHPGTDLQRLQVVKGWVDETGRPREAVYDVAGDPDNGAGVDPQSCAPTGGGFKQLCTVWTDPDFDPARSAVYYARVVENPSCRWSTLQCQAAGVNPFAEDCRAQAARATAHAKDELGAWGEDVYGSCCLSAEQEPFYSPTIQERAWTSPVWYNAQ